MRLMLPVILLAACQGTPEPAPRPRPTLDVPAVKKDLPRPKAATDDPAEPAAAPEGPMFEPQGTVSGVDGRVCGRWGDRVILTRPREDGRVDLRIRAAGADLDASCRWEGPATFEAVLEGEVHAVYGDKVLLHDQRSFLDATLRVLDLEQGTVIASIEPAIPRDDRDCGAWLADAWTKTLAGLDGDPRRSPALAGDTPSCDMLALRTCQLTFALPQEVDLRTGEVAPVGGPALCLGVP